MVVVDQKEDFQHNWYWWRYEWYICVSDTVFTSADSTTPAGGDTSAAPNVQPGATIQNCLIAAAGGGASVNYEDGHGGAGGVTAGGNSSNTDPATGGTWGGAPGHWFPSDRFILTQLMVVYSMEEVVPVVAVAVVVSTAVVAVETPVKLAGGAGGASYYKTTQPSPPAFPGYNSGSFSNLTICRGWWCKSKHIWTFGK